MILGIGTDLVDIARMRAALDRHGERFARRILSPAEWPDWESSKEPARLLAKRFAAKEAFSKVVHTGLRSPVTLRNIGIGHDELGRPEFILETPLQQWLQQKGIGKVHLSLSDEGDQILAFAIAAKS